MSLNDAQKRFYISFGVAFALGLFIVYKYVGRTASLVDKTIYFVYGFYFILSAFFYYKINNWWKVGLAVIVSSLTTVILFSSFVNSYAVSLSQPPVLDDNWWEALNWIRNNTPECAVIATYWDPGHFITGIAHRPVVFDGATQNAKLYIHEGNRTIVRSRIQDIATTLYTDNETKAIEILKYYKMPNCSKMYYIASADLIGKSHWWIYFATWKPRVKGHESNYLYAALKAKKPMISGNGTQYVYGDGSRDLFIVVQDGPKLTPYLVINRMPYKIEKIFYFENYTGYVQFSENPQVEGMLYVTPDMRYAFFIPKEVENSMFTRMFFFNGAGLKHFKLVKNFGGEVKLFEVVFNETE